MPGAVDVAMIPHISSSRYAYVGRFIRIEYSKYDAFAPSFPFAWIFDPARAV